MFRLKSIVFLVFVGMFAIHGGASQADETEGLYAPPPPADAAYVRLIDTSHQVSQASITLGAVSLAVGQDGVGAYSIIKQGQYDVALGKLKSTLNVEAGRYYTVVVSKEAVALVNDEASASGAKATLVFYNLSTQAPLSLVTADGALTVVEGVAAGASGSRQVRAMAVELAVRAADQSMVKLAATELERGQIYSIVATTGQDKPIHAIIVKNTVNLTPSGK